jgi:hypothetical protein
MFRTSPTWKASIGTNSDIVLVSLQSVQVRDVGIGISFGLASIATSKEHPFPFPSGLASIADFSATYSS